MFTHARSDAQAHGGAGIRTVALNGVAADLVDAASELKDQPVADVMRGLARGRRVEALMLQGRRVAATAEFVGRYGKPV